MDLSWIDPPLAVCMSVVIALVITGFLPPSYMK